MKLSNYCYVSAFWAAFCVKRVAANHCDRGQSELHLDIDIRPDAYPDETLWTLVNTCSGTTLDEVSLTGAQPGQIVEYDRCVSSFSTYAFTIFDLEGDGILSSPVGGYKLTLDGTVIQDIPEGDFTFIENTIFGNGCDAPPNSDNTCPEGLAKFQVEVEIKTDGNSQDDNSFTLKNACTNTLVQTQSFSTLDPWTIYNFDWCVEANSRYVFELNDVFGDGLEQGFVQLSMDGVQIKNVPAAFVGSGVTYAFGSTCGAGSKSGGGMGDPHFKTWNNTYFDFHGQCDMVLLSNPSFDGGAGLEVHVRTTIRYEYSYIEEVAIKIGNDVLEIGSWGEFFLNRIAGAEMPNKLADKFLVSQTSEDVKEHVFEISLGGPARMIVKSVKDMLSVKFVDAPGYYFENSVGLMGSYPTGDRVARDGKTILSDPNAFGQEWQVISDEPQLFMATRSPQHPQKCFLPDAKMKQSRRGRRLGEYIHREAAAKACAEWKEAEREACIYDVLATGDFEIAKAGGF